MTWRLLSGQRGEARRVPARAAGSSAKAVLVASALCVSQPCKAASSSSCLCSAAFCCSYDLCVLAFQEDTPQNDQNNRRGDLLVYIKEDNLGGGKKPLEIAGQEKKGVLDEQTGDKRQRPASEKLAPTSGLQPTVQAQPPRPGSPAGGAHTGNDTNQVSSVRKRQKSKGCAQASARLEGNTLGTILGLG